MRTLRSKLWTLGLIAAIPSFAQAVDGQPGFDHTTDSGLYVWRTWSGGWQARVVAADGERQVGGSFQSRQQIGSTSRIALESDDVLTASNSRTVNFDLRTDQYDVDGLALSVPEGGLCLRTTTAVPIYLGRDAEPATAPVDLTGTGACLSEGPRVPGLGVFRASQFHWAIQLAAENGPTEFNGTLEFSEPLESYEVDMLEATDQVSQSAADRLDVRLKTWPGPGRDVVRLTTLEFTRICLRSAGPAEQTLSLSSTGQAEPLRVTTPVDLTNNGACGAPADPFPPPTRGRKFNPGHYVALTPIDDHATMAESAVRGVRGFSNRYEWRELEPRWGEYDFSAIEEDLAAATALGVQFVAMIKDKTFEGEPPAPDYLRAWMMPNRSDGYTMARWHPYVRKRYQDLIAALGRRFDSHPNFEGIATSESAPGVNQDVLQQFGYTAEKYRDALIETLTSAGRSFPTSRVFWYMNFMPGALYYMGEIARSVAPHGVVLGGPDVMPDEVALQLHPYPFYDGALGRMPTFNQVEPSCYHHLHADPSSETRFWTPPELFEYARDELHVSYLFWVRWRWREFEDSYNWLDAIPVIESNPDFNLD